MNVVSVWIIIVVYISRNIGPCIHTRVYASKFILTDAKFIEYSLNSQWFMGDKNVMHLVAAGDIY